MSAAAGFKAIAEVIAQVPDPTFRSLWLRRLADHYQQAFATERDERRLTLWLPVCAGAGAVIHQCAAQEPSLLVLGVLAVLLLTACVALRRHVAAFRIALALVAVVIGMSTSAIRVARLDAPVIDRVRVVKLTGFIEEMDHRKVGARFILRITSASDLAPNRTPYRVRLTTPRPTTLEAGAHVSLSARLVPPSRAALPGGYDFARDAYFARLGAVGNALGRLEPVEAPFAADLKLRFYAAIDRARNALALRVEAAIGGPAGAIGAAMVTGKRDFLDDPTRETIRQAGIFHIITIAGVQMTLVAAIFFWGFRRLLALSPTLALNYPIKKWAAALAMVGAVAYDLGTGSRVGTERALYMTLIVLGAVLTDRQAFSMRNLALAATMIVIFEPEALLGASFQLSFAAVAGLIAVWEVRLASFAQSRQRDEMPLRIGVDREDRLLQFVERTRHGPAAMLISTICATAATTSFMAYNFHEFSPYVLIGNPLTLAMIEFFAVPGALLGTILFPLGLDGWVWTYLGVGIHAVMWVASWLAAFPGATIHLRAFHPTAIVFLSFAVLSAVLWRTLAFRLVAVPLATAGIVLAMNGGRHDVMIAPTGDALAFRGQDGLLRVIGRRPSPFMVEQWLRADADGRPAREANAALSQPSRAVERMSGQGGRCDASGCTATLADGSQLALSLDHAALAEDCERASLLVTPLLAPEGCRASLIIDRTRLAQMGAIALDLGADGPRLRGARVAGENRPWSQAPRPEPRRVEFVRDEGVDETPPFR